MERLNLIELSARTIIPKKQLWHAYLNARYDWQFAIMTGFTAIWLIWDVFNSFGVRSENLNARISAFFSSLPREKHSLIVSGYLTSPIERRREYLEKLQLISPTENANLLNILTEYHIPGKLAQLYPEILELKQISFDKLIDHISKNCREKEIFLRLLILFLENQLSQQLIYVSLAELESEIVISSYTGKWRTHSYKLGNRDFKISVPESIELSENTLKKILQKIMGYLSVLRLSLDLLEVPPVHIGKEIIEKGTLEDFKFLMIATRKDIAEKSGDYYQFIDRELKLLKSQ